MLACSAFILFQFVSKRFETIESVDLDIFSLFQFVAVSLLFNLYVSPISGVSNIETYRLYSKATETK